MIEAEAVPEVARPNLQMLFGGHLRAQVTPTAQLTGAAPIQTRVDHGVGHHDASALHANAERGIATSASPLPHAEMIQRSFGHHNISSIQAHVGPDAAASARAIGADAYATGNHVVLGERADMHTVAHEAAHVVQQRSGVQLKGGVGEAGDPYERHADQVADAVVAGRSAVELLDAGPGSTGQPQVRSGADSSVHGPGAIQRKLKFSDEITEEAKELISRVLASNPVLTAMWQWIEHHPKIHLEIVKTDGFAAVEAPLWATNIFLKIHPEKVTKNGGANVLGNLSHELTLHMLPWARPIMAEELRKHQNDGAMDEEQLTRIKTVLGSSDGLAREITADVHNKTTTGNGNHSDLALWTIHLRNMLQIAEAEKDQSQATLIVTTAIDKMVMSMRLTGAVDDAVDRGEEAFAQFLAVVTEVFEYHKKIGDQKTKEQFASHVSKIIDQAESYEANRRLKRQGNQGGESGEGNQGKLIALIGYGYAAMRSRADVILTEIASGNKKNASKLAELLHPMQHAVTKALDDEDEDEDEDDERISAIASERNYLLKVRAVLRKNS